MRYDTYCQLSIVEHFIFAKGKGEDELILHWKHSWVKASIIYKDLTLADDEWDEKHAKQYAKENDCRYIKTISLRWDKWDRRKDYIIT